MVGEAVLNICKDKKIYHKGVTHQELEITDNNAVKKIINKYNPGTIINMMAMTGTNSCEKDPLKAFAINSIAVAYLSKLCEKNKIALVQPSTHAVFDGKKDDYYTEDDLPNPINVYGASKYMTECFTKNFCSRYYIPRFPVLFGNRKNNLSLMYLSVNKVMETIKLGDELKVADDKIDSPTYVKDVASGIMSLLEEEKPFGIYHLSNSGKVSYYDFIIKFLDMTNTDGQIVRAKDKDFDSLGYKPLKTAMKSVKLPPMRNWQDALKEYVSMEVL